VPEAVELLQQVIQLNPEHFRANLLLGRILFLQGNPLGALTNLERASQVQPDSREAHLFLADAYTQLGRIADAQNERAAAQKLGGPQNH
jgi:cytochrome c-type biogenesis protein CcmH/NrfG